MSSTLTKYGDVGGSDFGASQCRVESVAGHRHVLLHAGRHRGGDVGAADPAAVSSSRRLLTRL